MFYLLMTDVGPTNNKTPRDYRISYLVFYIVNALLERRITIL